MTKKEYILTFLDKIKDVREPARGFLVLMRYNVFTDQQVEELFEVFKSVVKSSSDDAKKRKIQRAIAAVEHMRNQEKSENVLKSDLEQILTEI